MVRGARNADAYREALVIAVYDACLGGLLQVLDGITMHQVDVAALNALLMQCIEHLLCGFVDVVAVFNADALQFWIHVGHTQNNRTQARAHVDESIVDGAGAYTRCASAWAVCWTDCENGIRTRAPSAHAWLRVGIACTLLLRRRGPSRDALRRGAAGCERGEDQVVLLQERVHLIRNP